MAIIFIQVSALFPEKNSLSHNDKESQKKCLVEVIRMLSLELTLGWPGQGQLVTLLHWLNLALHTITRFPVFFFKKTVTKVKGNKNQCLRTSLNQELIFLIKAGGLHYLQCSLLLKAHLKIFSHKLTLLKTKLNKQWVNLLKCHSHCKMNSLK